METLSKYQMKKLERITENKESINLAIILCKKLLQDYDTMIKAYEEDVKIDGYVFNKIPYAILIWKPTDIESDPQYKGEPLLKVVPDTIDNYDIETYLKIIDAQPWAYL